MATNGFRFLLGIIIVSWASGLARAAIWPSSDGNTRWVAAVAHAPGAAGATWRTDLTILNVGTSAVSVELRLHRAEGISSRSWTIEAGAQQFLPDVVASLVAADAVGSLEVTSTGPIAVRSRTYDGAHTGTFGQSFDGIAASAGLVAGETALLQQLAETAAFRTNIGVLNMGNADACVTVALFAANGTEVGSFSLTVPSGLFVQDPGPYRNRFGRTDVAAGFARVRVDSGSDVIIYASRVGNATNDATTISMEKISGTSPSAVAYTGSFPAEAGEHDATLTLSGVTRNVFLYVPVSPGPRPPLLIALHGTGDGTESGMGRDMASNFQMMADAYGIILAGPEARVQPEADWDQHSAGQRFWETMPTSDPSRGSDPDRNPDLLLIRAIIQEAERVWNVDPTRIYVAGFSNGGFFSLTVAVALRNQIAAAAEMSSGLVRCDNTNNCVWAGNSTTCAGLKNEPDYCVCNGAEKPIAIPTSGRMPPLWITHGNQDWTVSVAYSCALAERLAALGHTANVEIRDRADHVMPEFSNPSVYQPFWAFFAAHPLPQSGSRRRAVRH